MFCDCVCDRVKQICCFIRAFFTICFFFYCWFGFWSVRMEWFVLDRCFVRSFVRLYFGTYNYIMIDCVLVFNCFVCVCVCMFHNVHVLVEFDSSCLVQSDGLCHFVELGRQEGRSVGLDIIYT